MHNKKLSGAIASIIACSGMIAFTQNTWAQTEQSESRLLEEVYVTGGKSQLSSISGSAHVSDRDDIARFDITDLTALMSSVPGVYIRQEDGYGLRPNIGIRGTTSERSTKVTIMEDGILIGPAPYAAPAAYYTPTVNRMYAVEVFKGPAAIRYGPHTVGGAVNFVTRPIATSREGDIELTVGDFNLRKLSAYYGSGGEQQGFSVDALHHATDGFKELDNGGDTGFEKNDLNGRYRWKSKNNSALSQELDIKIGYANEDSNETYLGLSDQDFDENPNRRYAASQLDTFETEHQQIHILHAIDFNEDWNLFTKAYYNDFDRAWNRFDNFIGGVDIDNVLSAQTIFENQYQLLTGERDSTDSDPLIGVNDNQRSFISQGIEFNLSHEFSLGGSDHELNAGILFHNDTVNRNHIARGYFIENQTLIFDGDNTRAKAAFNEGEADVIALYLRDEFRYGNWLINGGVRLEQIDTMHLDKLPAVPEKISDTQTAFSPGAGFVYEINERLSILGGIYKGFSPKAASADEEIESEESVNTEYGFRYVTENTRIEAIGFYSDYSNLLGSCREVDNSCDSDVNGGEVKVSGLEFSARHNFALSDSLSMPLSFVFTHTDAEFQTSFSSDFEQWGDVEAGDELPYLPSEQGRVEIGMHSETWAVDLALNHTGEMREVAGAGAPEEGEHVEALTTVNLAFSYGLNENIDLKLIGENIFDEQEIVSRRPIAARPNHPRLIKLSVSYGF